MYSPFEVALAQADKVIEQVIMSAYIINGKSYQGVFDELPKEVEPMNGVYRTLTLYSGQGYIPRKSDRVDVSGITYIVTGFSFNNGVIILQLEEDASY